MYCTKGKTWRHREKDFVRRRGRVGHVHLGGARQELEQRVGATGRGDGTTTTPGNQGSVNGDPLSDNYNGGGSGNGEKAPDGRSFVNYPKIEDDGQITGIIVIRYKVSKSGKITSANVTRGTTIGDLALRNKCISAMLNASMNSSDDAAFEQEGVKRFVFRVK